MSAPGIFRGQTCGGVEVIRTADVSAANVGYPRVMRLPQPRLGDWAVAAAGGASVAAFLAGTTVWAFPLAAATAFALLCIRRWTVPAALVLGALQLAANLISAYRETPAPLVPLLITAYSLGRRAAPARGALTGAAYLYCAMIGSVTDLATAVFGFLIFSGPFLLGTAVRRRARSAQIARAAAEALAGTDAAALTEAAIADERGRIGGQALSVIRSSVEQMKVDAVAAVRDLDPALIGRIAERGSEAVSELRWLLGLLRTREETEPESVPNSPPQAWIPDAGSAAAVLLLAVAEVLLVGPAPAGVLGWLLMLALPCALAIRHRSPEAASLAAAAVVLLMIIAGVPLLHGYVLAQTAVLGLLSWSVGAAGHSRAWAALAAAVTWQSWGDQPGNVPMMIAVLAVPALAGNEWAARDGDRRTAVGQHALLAAHLHSEVDAALRSERLRLARELHDVTSHAVGVMVLQASAAQALSSRDPAGARSALSNVISAGDRALSEISELFRVLDAGAIGSAGLTAPVPESLDGLTARMRAFGMRIDLDADDLSAPADVIRTVYRTVQEALTNVARHASGGRAAVSVRNRDGRIIVTVASDITGQQPARDGTGFGLIGVEERVRSMGGTFTVSETIDTFTVTALIPVSDASRS